MELRSLFKALTQNEVFDLQCSMVTCIFQWYQLLPSMDFLSRSNWFIASTWCHNGHKLCKDCSRPAQRSTFNMGNGQDCENCHSLRIICGIINFILQDIDQRLASENMLPPEKQLLLIWPRHQKLQSYVSSLK